MSDSNYAGFGIRLLASLVDIVLISLIVIPVLYAIYGVDYFTSESFYLGVWDGVFNYLVPALLTILFWVYKAATPGKLLNRLRIVDATTGDHPSTGQFLHRYIGYFVSMLPLFLGYIWVLFDKRKQGWHDKLANTVVVRVKA